MLIEILKDRYLEKSLSSTTDKGLTTTITTKEGYSDSLPPRRSALSAEDILRVYFQITARRSRQPADHVPNVLEVADSLCRPSRAAPEVVAFGDEGVDPRFRCVFLGAHVFVPDGRAQ